MKQGLHALQCMETLFLFQVVIPIQTISFYNSPVYKTLKKSSGIVLTFLYTLMH